MFLHIDFYNCKPYMLLTRYITPNYGRQQKWAKGFGKLTFQLLCHLGHVIPELRLVLHQFSVVLFQAITLRDRMTVLFSETDHFGF